MPGCFQSPQQIMTAIQVQTAAPPNVARAIGAMVTAIFLFSSMNAIIKWLAEDYPVSQIIFFRAVFALVAIMPLIAAAGGLRSLRTERPWGHALRCAAGVGAMTCGFTAITLLPLANAVALGFTAPLFTTLLGVVILGERVRWRRTVALIVGFGGVMLMLRPDIAGIWAGAGIAGPGGKADGDGFGLGNILALSGAFLAALAMISIRRLSSTEPSTTIVFYFMIAAALGSALFLPFQFVMPDVLDAVLLVAIGLIGGIAQVLLTQAYRQAPVAVVAPFDYTAMIWATGWGFVIWGEFPDMLVIAGALVVVASGVYITLREIKLGVTPAPQTKLRGEIP